jgi:imidazoleglycerol phosphate dehydratase HisB
MRESKVSRKTNETDIEIKINLDGSGNTDINTGIPFFDHMLNSFAKHGSFDLKVSARGDLTVDDHHTVEDVGIALGTVLSKALGDKKGIERFGEASVPMDEALATVALDLSGRGSLYFNYSVIEVCARVFISNTDEDYKNYCEPKYNGQREKKSLIMLSPFKGTNQRIVIPAEDRYWIKLTLKDINGNEIPDNTSLLPCIETGFTGGSVPLDRYKYGELKRDSGKLIRQIHIKQNEKLVIYIEEDIERIQSIDFEFAVDICEQVRSNKTHFASQTTGGFNPQNTRHFFESLTGNAGINAHMDVTGENDHHKIEALFKGFGIALKRAVRISGSGVPSTKGVL